MVTNKILFLNVDGTLTTTNSGELFKQNSQDVVVLPGVVDALNYFKSVGWLLVGISNQSSIATGDKSLKDVKAEMQFTIELLPQMRSIYFCPDLEGFYCWRIENNWYMPALFDTPYKGYYRMPNPGMLLYAYNFENECDNPQNFMKDCYMVSDRVKDSEIARNAGCSFLDGKSFRDGFLLETNKSHLR